MLVRTSSNPTTVIIASNKWTGHFYKSVICTNDLWRKRLRSEEDSPGQNSRKTLLNELQWRFERVVQKRQILFNWEWVDRSEEKNFKDKNWVKQKFYSQSLWHSTHKTIRRALVFVRTARAYFLMNTYTQIHYIAKNSRMSQCYLDSYLSTLKKPVLGSWRLEVSNV